MLKTSANAYTFSDSQDDRLLSLKDGTFRRRTPIWSSKGILGPASADQGD